MPYSKIIMKWGLIMYLHKEEDFHDVVIEVSRRSGIPEDIIEKDYYVTMLLRELTKKNTDIVFKGGTSLSKAYHVIDRFSEDIDITFTEHIGAAKRKGLKYKIIQPVSEELGLSIKNWDKIESNKDYNRYEFIYESVAEVDNPLPSAVILETALMSYSFPTELKKINSIIYQYIKDSDRQIASDYGLEPFLMKVQMISRTLIDKMFAVCDYYMLDKARRNSRHLYDIYKLYPYVTEDDSFYELVREVRKHRAEMDIKVAPSARENVDVKETVNKLCSEDFYKDDYELRTRGLISDDIGYDMVICFYKELMERVFT